MDDIKKIIEGYKSFYWDSKSKIGESIKNSQKPVALIIACSDSRVDPAILFNTNLGDIFQIRNVANLVPPYEPESTSHHGISSSIEFAVLNLNIKHIIVLGHSGCSGIKALVDEHTRCHEDFSFVLKWVNIAKSAKEKACDTALVTGEDKYLLTEQEAIKTSLENLRSFPWIKDREEKKQITLHGWYFCLQNKFLKLLSEDGHFYQIDV